jgi:hypothetical protein
VKLEELEVLGAKAVLKVYGWTMPVFAEHVYFNTDKHLFQ